ncbi:transposable element Tcb2 transposase [Trichonephila clavipes]|nr:transposable element Tcb2 transposase [Trichonephila clavipes]
MKLQKMSSGDQYSEHKKTTGLLHTWKKDRKAGGEAYCHQCSCRVRNQQKCRFERLESAPNPREIGTRFYRSNIKERHHYAGPGALLWGVIMLNGRTKLHIFDRGSVIGDRYCEEVLLPHVHLFRGAIRPDFIFMDGNARPHRILAVKQLLEREDINRMDWPPYSPVLNPIEHVWDVLDRRIAARLHHPENTQQLKQMLIDEWAILPQEMLHQLVLSMRKRCEATIAVRGGHVQY